MTEDAGKGPTGPFEPEGWPLKDVWEKYEEIAMHFNDLIMRLRTQALAAVAAISVLASIFGKTGADPQLSGELAALVFSLLSVFWIAIWVIDVFYYNKLLIGAVSAIVVLEKMSNDTMWVHRLDISTKIENAVAGIVEAPNYDYSKRFKLAFGRRAFYLIVFFALIGGLSFSVCESQRNLNSAQPTVSAPG
jgi:hypothetical protein